MAEREVIIILLLILHILLVIFSALNIKYSDKKSARICWVICLVFGLVMGIIDIFKL